MMSRMASSSKGFKRPGPPMKSGSGSEAKKRSREQVEVLEEAWCEALKFLKCSKWSKMRLVTRQLNGLVGRNVSRLPKTIIDCVVMRMEQRTRTENKMIAWDSTISPEEKIIWFKDHGINLYLPADIELNNAIIGVDLNEKRSIDLGIQGNKKKFNARVLFSAEFSPNRNPYSWPAMAYFLKMIYDHSTFVEELSMYAFDKKLKEILFPGKENRYVSCGTFTLQVTNDPSSKDLCESLSWVEQNVHANMIEIPTFLEYDEEEICNVVSNFLLGSSWISASQEVNLGHVNELEEFFRALIKKFRTLAAMQSTFPIIMLSGIRFPGTTFALPLEKLLSGKEDLEDSEGDDEVESPGRGDESDDSKDDRDCKTYTISNGPNRMHVKIKKPRETVPPRGRQTACKRAGGPPVAMRQLATKASRGPRPTNFDIRVRVKTAARNGIQ